MLHAWDDRYPWDGNTNDANGTYNLQSGSVSFNSTDYVAIESTQFNGTSNYLTYTDSPFMTQPTSNLSIMFWVKPSDLTGIETLYEEGNNQHGIAIRLNNGNLEYQVRQSWNNRTWSTPFPADGKWHFVARVYDRSAAAIRFYLDGVLLNTMTANFGDLRQHSDPGAFGSTQGFSDAFDTSGPGNYYSGLLDEAAYYYTDLTNAQIASIYNCLRPNYDYGDAPASYGMADHKITETLFLGSAPDHDSGNWGNGTEDAPDASDDDNEGLDDEDGIPTFARLTDLMVSYGVNLRATNNTGVPAMLWGWLDLNGNGTFDSGESVSVPVANGSDNIPVTLNWTELDSFGLTAGTVLNGRFRLTTDSSVTASSPSSSAIDGEVEDYQLNVDGQPLLTILKQSSSPTTSPGSIIIYTIRVQNTGTGEALNVTLTDRFSSYSDLFLDAYGPDTLFTFSDGANSSLLPGTATVQYPTDGTNFDHIPINVGGYDPNVRAFKLIMDGTMGTDTAAPPFFDIYYQVRVK